MSCEDLQQNLNNFSLIYACDVIKNGAFRIATPFTYPNGSHIDVFLKNTKPLITDYILSDYGQTYDYLLEMGFNLWTTKKRRQLVTDICSNLGVKYNQNMFEVMVKSDLSDLSDCLVRLAQTCIRITDLSFTQRAQTFATFETEVEEFIALSDLDYDIEPNDLIGMYDKPVKVDFRVKGNRINSLVQTWSTRNSTISHTTSTEIFTRWHDLQRYKASYQFITVYDDTYSSFRNDDLSRLYEYSQVFSFPQQREQFRETIRA